MADDPLKDLPEPLRTAAAGVVQRIRWDRGQAKDLRLLPVFDCLETDVFDEELNVDELWRRCGVNDRSVKAGFRLQTGEKPAEYLQGRRIEGAIWMLHHTDLDCMEIGPLVTYKNYSTFNRVCRSVCARIYGGASSPLKVRQAGPETITLPMPPVGGREFTPPLAQPVVHLPASGEHRLEPSPLEDSSFLEISLGAGQSFPIDRKRHHEYYAAGIWKDIRDLPYEEQWRVLMSKLHLVKDRALFDLLRAMALVEGRRDRRRGIELMDLALLSLGGGEQVFGPSFHDLMALGLAALGNHHRFAGDFSAALAAFERSDQAWHMPGAPHDPLIAAEIMLLQGTLLMTLRRDERAAELIDGARESYREAGDRKGEVQCLNQRAVILVYWGKLEAAIETLLEAQEMVARLGKPYLAYSVASGLANVYGRLGNFEAAFEQLARAKEHHAALDHPLGVHELSHLEASLRHDNGECPRAEGMYSEARLGFVEAEVMTAVALVDLDLALLYSEQGEWTKVLERASDAVPILEPLKLNSETLSAVKLLCNAVKAGEITQEILREARDNLKRDPLIYLA